MVKYFQILLIPFLGIAPDSGHAHHAPLLYDSSSSIKLDATVDTIKMANPHSRLSVTIMNPQGKKESWTVSLPGVTVSRRQGQLEALRGLKKDDRLFITGWPHKVNRNEIRSEKIQFPDGKIKRQVTDPNFQHKDNIALKKLLDDPGKLDDDVDPDITAETRIQLWITENSYVERLAVEIHAERQGFINIIHKGSPHFYGIEDHLTCLPDKTSYYTIDGEKSSWVQEASGIEYISQYNDLLARHLEMQLITCGH